MDILSVGERPDVSPFVYHPVYTRCEQPVKQSVGIEERGCLYSDGKVDRSSEMFYAAARNKHTRDDEGDDVSELSVRSVRQPDRLPRVLLIAFFGGGWAYSKPEREPIPLSLGKHRTFEVPSNRRRMRCN